MGVHVRKQIRDAVLLAVTGLATTGANVFAEKTTTLEDSALPALTFASRTDTPDIEPGRVEVGKFGLTPHEYLFVINAHVKQAAGLADVLDTISSEVTVALAGGVTIAGATRYPILIEEEFDFTGEGEQPVATLSMAWRVNYYAKTNQPDV